MVYDRISQIGLDFLHWVDFHTHFFRVYPYGSIHHMKYTWTGLNPYPPWKSTRFNHYKSGTSTCPSLVSWLLSPTVRQGIQWDCCSPSFIQTSICQPFSFIRTDCSYTIHSPCQVQNLDRTHTWTVPKNNFKPLTASVPFCGAEFFTLDVYPVAHNSPPFHSKSPPFPSCPYHAVTVYHPPLLICL